MPPNPTSNSDNCHVWAPNHDAMPHNSSPHLLVCLPSPFYIFSIWEQKYAQFSGNKTCIIPKLTCFHGQVQIPFMDVLLSNKTTVSIKPPITPAGLPIVPMIDSAVSVVSILMFDSPKTLRNMCNVRGETCPSSWIVTLYRRYQATIIYWLVHYICLWRSRRLYKHLHLMVCHLNSMNTLLFWNYALLYKT